MVSTEQQLCPRSRLLITFFGRRDLRGRNVRCPGHAGLGFVIHRFARHVRHVDEMIATRALELAPGEFLVTSHSLFAMGTFEFEFAHNGRGSYSGIGSDQQVEMDSGCRADFPACCSGRPSGKPGWKAR